MTNSDTGEQKETRYRIGERDSIEEKRERHKREDSKREERKRYTGRQ